MNFIRTNK